MLTDLSPTLRNYVDICLFPWSKLNLLFKSIHLFHCSSIYPSIIRHPSPIHSAIHLSIHHPSIFTNLSTYHPPIIYSSIRPSIIQPSIILYLSSITHPFIHQPTHPSIHQSIHPSTHLSNLHEVSFLQMQSLD